MLRVHRHERVQVLVYTYQETRVYMYFNGGRSHWYQFCTSVHFTRTSSFCAGRVFIQPVWSEQHRFVLINLNFNLIYTSHDAYSTSRLISLLNCSRHCIVVVTHAVVVSVLHRIAYVVYRTGQLAHAAASDYAGRTVELDGHHLKVYKYKVPIDSRPACM